MSRARTLTVEPSRDDGWGIPYRSWSGRVRVLRRAALSLVAVTALVVASAATAASLVGNADAGVALSADGDRVDWVSPAGFAWEAGIRAGQTVVSLRDSGSPDGWRLETLAGDQKVSADATSIDAWLRGLLPLAVAATLVGALAVILLRGNRRWVTAAACISLAAAVPAIELYGKVETSTFAMGSAALAPAIWLAWRPRLPPAASAAVTGVVVVFLAAWVVARLEALPDYDRLEAIRTAVAFAGMIVVVTASVIVPIVREGPASIGRPAVGDTLVLAIAVGIALGLLAILSPLIGGILLLAAVLLVPAWRRWLAAGAERMLLADLRESARLEAAEAERAHLSRELHDAPLQQLAGIIRRLELLPGARAESEELRAVAEQLRGVATELRPPVLDDLGLAPALEFLAEAASTDEVAVVAEVEDLTSLDVGGRPPAAVELAIFRVAQEAVANALRHAQASEISLAGEVAAGRVVLTVTDDGRGLDEAEARAAGRRGRLGLASIRRRAEAIDAEVDISGSREGTRVAVRWTR
jgi:signal transduction histidine kinase